MNLQEQLFPHEIIETRLPSNLPGNVAELTENFMMDSVRRRIERRGYGIFISSISLPSFAERFGHFYLDQILGVDPERYEEQLSTISNVVDQKFTEIDRITPDELDAWKVSHGV